MSSDPRTSHYAPESQAATAMSTSSRRAPTELISSHPASSVLTTFGLGFGIGLAMGLMLAESGRRSRMRDMGMAERIGRQVLEAIHSALPESLSYRS